jgi:hypothetical protein
MSKMEMIVLPKEREEGEEKKWLPHERRLGYKLWIRALPYCLSFEYGSQGGKDSKTVELKSPAAHILGGQYRLRDL